MFQRIGCYTLFDITQTGVLNRSRPPENAIPNEWSLKRNQQANFDTIIQAISLRSQPENITKPKKQDTPDNIKFGRLYQNTKECWHFTFSVNFASVYDDGQDELGYLYADCEGIPMINIDEKIDKLPNFLKTDLDNKNIYFVKYTDES